MLNKLRRELEVSPSRSAIYRCLVRHHLIQPKPRRRRRDDYKRWERSRAMELWQVDVLGGVQLTNGIAVSVVTGIDDHSRFCVIAKVVARATARPVCDVLMEALNTYGVPEQILTDNGKVFTGRLGRRPANVQPNSRATFHLTPAIPGGPSGGVWWQAECQTVLRLPETRSG
jgi:transposase InsO family protein